MFPRRQVSLCARQDHIGAESEYWMKVSCDCLDSGYLGRVQPESMMLKPMPISALGWVFSPKKRSCVAGAVA
jgi:hypothetical protein